jgi:hypothetical protein
MNTGVTIGVSTPAAQGESITLVPTHPNKHTIASMYTFM